jgi:hypothetical protein
LEIAAIAEFGGYPSNSGSLREPALGMDLTRFRGRVVK